MNNQQRKKRILDLLDERACSDVFEALAIVGGDVSALEAVPFGRRGELTQICEDLADGKINGIESLLKLRDFVMAVPD